MAVARTSDAPFVEPFVGKAVCGVLEGALVGPDVTELFVGVSAISVVKPTGASEAGRIGGKSGLVVGLSTKLIPSAKLGSEAPNTGLTAGTSVTFVGVRGWG